MSNRWAILAGCVAFLTVFTFSFQVKATDTGVSGVNLEFFHPAFDRTGIYGVDSSQMLESGELVLGLSQSWVQDNLFDISLNGVGVALVDRFSATHLTAALGLNSAFTLGFEIPLFVYLQGTNFNSLESFNSTSLGDIRFNTKIKILGESNKVPGLALKVFTDFPTGNENLFLGRSHVSPGVELITSKHFRYLDLNMTVGGYFPPKQNVLGIIFNDWLTYGLGTRVPVYFLDKNLSFLGEVRGHVEPSNWQVATSPIEFTAGIEKVFKNGMALKVGAGGAFNNAIGNPRLRGLLDFSWPLHLAKR